MKRIYLYLFIFAVLMNVFTYMYFTKKAQYEAEITNKKVSKLEDKQKVIDSLEFKILEISNYTLQGNGAAQDYVERYVSLNDLERIKNSILELNHTKGGNTLVGYPDDNDPYVISRMIFVNHRWIIADFDNSQLGGQVLIRYYVSENGAFEFEAVDKAFYLPKSF